MSRAQPADKAAQLRIAEQPGVSQERRLASILINPAVHSAATCVTFGTSAFGKTEITETLEEVVETIDKVRKGDLSGPEATLVSQAHSLNAIFSEFARRSALNMGEYIEACEKYMKLALKAQAQCRATIETLAAIKNPPVLFAKPSQHLKRPSAGEQWSSASRGRKQKVRRTNYWSSAMSNGWTQERRQRQSEAIRRWSPWKYATGPRTAAGKAQCSRNAYKGGRRSALRAEIAAIRGIMAEFENEVLC